VKTVGILVRIHSLEDTVRIHSTRQGKLNDEPRAGWICIQSSHGLENLILTGMGRQIHANRFNSHLGAVPMLSSNIGNGSRILADQDGSKAGKHSASAQNVSPCTKFILDLACASSTIKNLRITFPRSPH